MTDYKIKEISELDIPEVSGIDLSEFDDYESSLDFSDTMKVREILKEHFLNGEHETFFEVLSLFIDHVGKSKIALETNIPERTIYNFINGQHKTSSENIFKVMRYIANEANKYIA